MFADLSLPIADADSGAQRDRILMLLTLGYTSGAVSQTAIGRLADSNRCSIQPVDRHTLESARGAQQLLRLREGSTFARFAAGGQAIQQLTRLTFEAAEPMQAQQLAANDAVVRSYDIVAIVPKTERVLQQACSSLDVDLISLELSQRLPFKLRLSFIKTALDRGIYFEVCYAPVLRDAASRRNLFSNAQALARVTRGKNIVLSSGARHAFEMRGPYDVINMASLFGLTQAQAKASISSNAAAVIAHGATRKYSHGAVQVLPQPAVPAQLPSSVQSMQDAKMSSVNSEQAAQNAVQTGKRRRRR